MVTPQADVRLIENLDPTKRNKETHFHEGVEKFLGYAKGAGLVRREGTGGRDGPPPVTPPYGEDVKVSSSAGPVPFSPQLKNNTEEGEHSRDAHEHRALQEIAESMIEKARLKLPAAQCVDELSRRIRWSERKQVVLQTVVGARTQYNTTSLVARRGLSPAPITTSGEERRSALRRRVCKALQSSLVLLTKRRSLPPVHLTLPRLTPRPRVSGAGTAMTIRTEVRVEISPFRSCVSERYAAGPLRVPS